MGCRRQQDPLDEFFWMRRDREDTNQKARSRRCWPWPIVRRENAWSKKQTSESTKATKKDALKISWTTPPINEKNLNDFLGRNREMSDEKKTWKKLKEIRKYRAESIKVRKTKANKHSWNLNNQWCGKIRKSCIFELAYEFRQKNDEIRNSKTTIKLWKKQKTNILSFFEKTHFATFAEIV